MLDRRDFLLLASAGLLAGGQDPFDALPASVWTNARRNGLVMVHRPAPASLLAEAHIAPPHEPGERISVAGHVFDADGRTPASGVTVYAYNTDIQGYYGENHKEFPPRICGWMKTDAAGRFTLRTIRPGNYPGMQVPAHVHFVLWGSGYPPQWVDDLKIAGDRYLTPDKIAEDARLGEFRTIQPLVPGENNVLHCAFRIRLQHATNYV